MRSVGPKGRSSAGFSLLEMVVAVAILAISLTALYRAAGGATRSVGIDEKMVYGVELARSVLALHRVVPASGFSDNGETEGGFRWQVKASPLALPDEASLNEGHLQHLEVTVSWADGGRDRQFSLASVVAGKEER